MVASVQANRVVEINTPSGCRKSWLVAMRWSRAHRYSNKTGLLVRHDSTIFREIA